MKVAINGFGRIGRLTLRMLLKKKHVEVVGINDLTDNATLVHLFKYDSSQGNFEGDASLEGDNLVVGNQKIRIFSERDPLNLPWKELEVDYVVESTGVFRTFERASFHLQAGAKKVVLSAPAKGDDIPTVVLGVNEEILTADMTVISNASCTTNCAAPMIKAMVNAFGIEAGFLTTVHAYTADQRLQDSPHSDLRRARAAALNIIPTTTGAAKAVGLVVPEVKGILEGTAYRVPVPAGSFTELTLQVKKSTTKEAVNEVMKNAANANPSVVQYSEDALVSSDIVGNSHSCIFDAQLTTVLGDMVRLSGWYDNEAGYASRVADLLVKLDSL